MRLADIKRVGFIPWEIYITITRGTIFYSINLTASGIQNSSNDQIAIDNDQQSSDSSQSTAVNSKQDANVPKLPSKEEVSSDSSEPLPNLSKDITLVAHWPLDNIAGELTQEMTGNAMMDLLMAILKR
jgi:hypothetical protein